MPISIKTKDLFNTPSSLGLFENKINAEEAELKANEWVNALEFVRRTSALKEKLNPCSAQQPVEVFLWIAKIN